ncbi:MAG TPA: FtsX-like permease family protein [Candidatus Acidoferrales bacterium]|jgi:putative ABC transport system permease protein
MFWRILEQLFRASRGRLAVALLALASGAAVTTALINLNLDAERKVSGEFRTLGANVLILPHTHEAAGFKPDSGDVTMPKFPLVSGDSPLLSESLLTRLGSLSEGNHIVVAPYLYVVAGATGVGTEARVIVAGTWLDRTSQLAPWWRITGQVITDRADFRDCLVGANVARQLKISPGSQISLGNVIRSRQVLETLTVAGIVDSGGQEDDQVITNLSVAQGLAGLEDQIGVVQLSIPGTPTEISQAIAKISAALPDVEVRPVPQIAQAEASLLPRIRGLIFFMVALILVLTTLCVFASMAALAMERRRDVGLMKAIGGSISRIVRIFFTEAAALGLAGALIGYVAGIFLSRWIGERAFHVAISARPEVLPIVVALMVVVSLAGALPLRLLGRIRPAEILRGE